MNKPHAPTDLLDAVPMASEGKVSPSDTLLPEGSGIFRKAEGNIADSAILRPSSLAPECPQCGKHFAPRGSGKEQKFCSTSCRREYHDAPERRDARSGNVRSPGTLQTDEPEGKGGVFIDHRPEGGPLLLVPERDLKRVNQIGVELKAEEFDWCEDDSVVLREQPATAIYRNTYGGLVIRQERAWDQEEDTIIVIAPSNVQEFVDRLTDVVGIPSVP